MKKALFSFVLSLALGGSLTSFVSGANEQDEIRKSFNLNPQATVSLDNVNGSVTIKTWDQPKIEITAIKTGDSKEKIDLVDIVIKAQPDSVDIDTIYPKGIKNVNVAVKYEITVPKNVNLKSIQTVNGSINITGVEGRIQTETVNGSITITGGNTVSAETVNGSIKATLLQLPDNEKANFETVNGSINLYLPNSIDLDLSAETVNGKISSDLTAMVTSQFSKKQLKGKVGRGGAKLNLETVNGSITLSQGQLQ